MSDQSDTQAPDDHEHAEGDGCDFTPEEIEAAPSVDLQDPEDDD